MSEWLGMFHADLFLKFAAALVALMNPLYGIPIFLGMTEGFSTAERRRIASIIAVTILIAAIVARAATSPDHRPPGGARRARRC